MESDRVPQLSLHSPVGDITVSQEDGCIVAIDWGWGRDQTETPLLIRARDQLHAYFDGDRLDFDLPLAPHGTPYRQRVWAALRAIPPGSTRTYIDIARIAGGSPRSVGGANGANPIPIVIPCHRVVATTGIGGYSGGDGLPTKHFLLSLEARAIQAQAGAADTQPTGRDKADRLAGLDKAGRLAGLDEAGG
jgi:methylated-DNA-[protein]-cysteine S-methyltransferase